MTLAQKIKYLRQKAGLTQQEFADKLSISRSTLAGYEAESKLPSYQVLIQIANYFNVTTDYLLDAGLFEEKTYHLITLYRDVILKKLYDEGLITKHLYNELHYCSMEKCVMFLSTVISDVTGNDNKIHFSYSSALGELGKSMYETLTSEQKEQFKFHALEEGPTSQKQQEILEKIDELSLEQQSKILDYINMSYEIEKASVVAAAGARSNTQGKSSPSSGTEGGAMVG